MDNGWEIEYIDEIAPFTEEQYQYLINRRTKMYEDQIKQMQAAQGIGLQNYKPLTIREEIKGEIHMLEERLKKKKEMLTLLDENPAIEKFMDLSRN